jgi:threonine aldolase
MYSTVNNPLLSAIGIAGRTSRPWSCYSSLCYRSYHSSGPHSLSHRSLLRSTKAALSLNLKHQLSTSTRMNELQQNAWSSPGRAEFDFRSDVVTSPTMSMLQAIQSATLFDDVFNEDTTTQALEKLVCDLTGKEAGLFVMSGTMSNQVAMRTHLGGPPHSILCDHRGHVVLYEAGGSASLCGALIKAVVPKNGHHLTLEDVEANACLDDDVHMCPTKVISLENTINGTIVPLEESQRISNWAKDNGVIMHLDGARLWEVVAAGAGSLKDHCAAFDSVSLCFSKGLGAPIGSILLGNTKFITKARWIRKMLGGGVRQGGVISAPARVAVEETFLGDKLKAGHEKAKALGKFCESLGIRLHEAVETNMVWIEFGDLGVSEKQWTDLQHKYGIRLSGGRFVIHYQISDLAISKLKLLLQEITGQQ